MDTVSHGAWGYLIWYKSPLTWAAVVASMLPDLLSVIPAGLATFVSTKGNWEKTFHSKGMPAWAATYKRVMFPITHSLVVAMGVWFTVAAAWSPQWWLLGWPLHILIDIVSHPREKATPFLWPLITTKVHGIPWYSRKFTAVNVAVLALVAYAMFH